MAKARPIWYNEQGVAAQRACGEIHRAIVQLLRKAFIRFTPDDPL